MLAIWRDFITLCWRGPHASFANWQVTANGLMKNLLLRNVLPLEHYRTKICWVCANIVGPERVGGSYLTMSGMKRSWFYQIIFRNLTEMVGHYHIWGNGSSLSTKFLWEKLRVLNSVQMVLSRIGSHSVWYHACSHGRKMDGNVVCEITQVLHKYLKKIYWVTLEVKAKWNSISHLFLL